MQEKFSREEVLDINSIKKKDNRYIITLTFWKYSLYKKLMDCGYKVLYFSELVNFTLYKSVIVNEIYPKCQELNCKSLVFQVSTGQSNQKSVRT